MANEEIHDEALSKHLLSLKKKVDASIPAKIQKHTGQNQVRPEVPSLCLVPTWLRSQNREAYWPSTISIGPLHSFKKDKEKMAVKISYMRSLFDRTGASEATERACMAAMLRMEPNVRQCYIQAKLEEGLELAQMMLIDGCFIVELLYKNYKQVKYDYNDPFLRNPSNYYAVQRDLVLLENQIPFFVLEELFSKTVGIITSAENNKPTLTNLVLSFFGDMMGMTQVGKQEIRYDTNPFHILHLLHSRYMPSTEDQLNYKYEEVPAHKYSATRLDMAGIKFQASKTYGDLFDIKFSTGFRCSCLCRGGSIEIPHFSIFESTEPLLKNLIAFEQSFPWVKSFFTSHAFLMDILIDYGRDVELLEEAGVIDNYLGSSEAVCRVFNDICKNIAVPRHFLYGRLLKDVMNFCTPWQCCKKKPLNK
ncbi:UPF0481 protein At3g47200-like isoform X2 [Cornus florida]|uniref:UPF0481 protein At3g47200-like isoform X2 n=1 Tax=Cornus florida TaxID=4283 RepID=UPI00289CCF85|nr:UPF0481 protein At3g47200-like isoform X2 [Cornus florida]